MTRNIESEEDIDSLAGEWDNQEAANNVRRIQKIEDLPPFEQINGEEIKWIVDGIFAEGLIHMVTSEPGAGKSTLMSAMAYAISIGQDFLGRKTSKRPVLLLDAENPYPAIRERFNRLGIMTNDQFKVWGQWVGDDPPAAGGAIVLEWVSRCDPKPVILVDSVIAFHPGAENDSNETRRYMAQYRRLTAMGATPGLLHHIGKSETSKDYRGSSDYKASIDIGYKLTNHGDPARLSTLELRPFKQRVSVAPVLHLRYSNGVFSINQEESFKSTEERLCDLLKQNRGITKAEFESLALKSGIRRNAGREFLAGGIKTGTIEVVVGTKNRQCHSWAGKPVSFDNE